MFKIYRDLLKILSDESWASEENLKKIENILHELEKTVELEIEGFVLIDTVKQIINIAFSKKDRELLHIGIKALINLDEVFEDRERSIVSEMERQKEPEKKVTEVSKKVIIDVDRFSSPHNFKKEDILSRDPGPITIYKPVFDLIMKRIPKGDFSVENVRDVIKEYWHNILESKISQGSICVYANKYIKYMVKTGLITRDDVLVSIATDKLLHWVKAEKKDEKKGEKKVDRTVLSKHAQYIVTWAEKNATDVIDIKTMMDNRIQAMGDNITYKGVHEAVYELEKLDLAKSLDKKKFIVRRHLVK